MNRFPIVTVYRGLFLAAAMALVVGGTIVGLLSMSANTFDFSEESVFTDTDALERFFHFIRYFGPAVLIALVFMLISELIKLRMAVESHLYHMRHGDEALELNLIAGGVSLEEAGISSKREQEPAEQTDA
jgi:hypothetical protein